MNAAHANLRSRGRRWRQPRVNRRACPGFSSVGVGEVVQVELSPGKILRGRLVGRRGGDCIIDWGNGSRGCVRAKSVRLLDLFGSMP
jgi:hypothetical protein